MTKEDRYKIAIDFYKKCENNGDMSNYNEEDFVIENFTCNNCDYEHKCNYAWDLYNTNGNCLENK